MLSDLSPSEHALAEYMSCLSEEAYHAGWMDGLELALWKALVVGPYKYGRLLLTSEHVDRLRLLSAECGGWIRFHDDAEERFVPLSEWKAHADGAL